MVVIGVTIGDILMDGSSMDMCGMILGLILTSMIIIPGGIMAIIMAIIRALVSVARDGVV